MFFSYVHIIIIILLIIIIIIIIILIIIIIGSVSYQMKFSVSSVSFLPPSLPLMFPWLSNRTFINVSLVRRIKKHFPNLPQNTNCALLKR